MWFDPFLEKGAISCDPFFWGMPPKRAGSAGAARKAKLPRSADDQDDVEEVKKGKPPFPDYSYVEDLALVCAAQAISRKPDHGIPISQRRAHRPWRQPCTLAMCRPRSCGRPRRDSRTSKSSRSCSRTRCRRAGGPPITRASPCSCRSVALRRRGREGQAPRRGRNDEPGFPSTDYSCTRYPLFPER